MACGTPQHCATSAPRGWPVPQKRHSCVISCNVSPVALKFGLEEVGSCRGHILFFPGIPEVPFLCIRCEVRRGGVEGEGRGGSLCAADACRVFGGPPWAAASVRAGVLQGGGEGERVSCRLLPPPAAGRRPSARCHSFSGRLSRPVDSVAGLCPAPAKTL